jgi:uncharacterized repeat protein (TIGR01451 family)
MVVTGLAVPAGVLAASTLDQSDLIQNSSLFNGAGAGVLHGQVFTAGLTGVLDMVSIYPETNLSGAGVEIHTTSGGVPTTTVIGTGTIASSSINTFVDIAISPAAPVTAGTQYALLIAMPLSGGLGTDNTNSYPGGDAGFFDGATWTPIPLDLTFRTYVSLPPTIIKAFSPAQIPLNGTSTLTITITNPNATVPLNGVGFTDTYPTGLVTASPSNLATTCGGVAFAGSGLLSLTGGTIAAGSSCTVSVSVKGSGAGVLSNTTSAVTSTEGGDGTTSNTATLTVVAPPSIAKAFSPSTIVTGDISTLTFTINNPNTTVGLTGVGFSDSYPAGLVTAATPNLTNTCAGTAAAFTSSVSLSSGSIPASGSCTVSVDVTATTYGVMNNTSGAVTSTEGGTGNTASAALTVFLPTDLSITKTHTGNFSHGGTGLYTITVANAANALATSGLVTVKDTLPGVMTPMSVNAPGWTCSWTMTQVTCTRANSLAGGASYPPISLTVHVSPFGAGRWVNVAKVSGGGDTFNGNNLATDPTIVQ